MGISARRFDRELAASRWMQGKRPAEKAGYLQDFLVEDAPQPSVYNL